MAMPAELSQGCELSAPLIKLMSLDIETAAWIESVLCMLAMVRISITSHVRPFFPFYKPQRDETGYYTQYYYHTLCFAVAFPLGAGHAITHSTLTHTEHSVALRTL